MAEKILKAEKREISTKGAVKQLRRDGFIPGVLYSKGNEGIIFYADEIALNKLVFTSETSIIQLAIEGEEPHGCIIKDVQFDPVTDKIVHIDLQGITLGEVLQLEVPISYIGTAVGVKNGGVLQEQLHKLEIECLPRDIPQNIEVDVTELQIGDSIRASDLNLENITIITSADASLVSVVPPMADEVSEEDAEETADEDEITEPEVIGKGKDDDE